MHFILLKYHIEINGSMRYKANRKVEILNNLHLRYMGDRECHDPILSSFSVNLPYIITRNRGSLNFTKKPHRLIYKVNVLR